MVCGRGDIRGRCAFQDVLFISLLDSLHNLNKLLSPENVDGHKWHGFPMSKAHGCTVFSTVNIVTLCECLFSSNTHPYPQLDGDTF